MLLEDLYKTTEKLELPHEFNKNIIQQKVTISTTHGGSRTDVVNYLLFPNSKIGSIYPLNPSQTDYDEEHFKEQPIFGLYEYGGSTWHYEAHDEYSIYHFITSFNNEALLVNSFLDLRNFRDDCYYDIHFEFMANSIINVVGNCPNNAVSNTPVPGDSDYHATIDNINFYQIFKEDGTTALTTEDGTTLLYIEGYSG